MTSEHPASFPAVARLTALAHQAATRTAGGEKIAGAEQATAMSAGKLYDVLMTDIKYAGGNAGMLAIAEDCAANGVDFAPHNPTGPIAHLASVHACAASPTLLWLEHQWNETPLFDALVGGSVTPLADGAFVVPAKPGLGAEFDRVLANSLPGRVLEPGSGLDPRLG
jgi:galactonate dehydratase